MPQVVHQYTACLREMQTCCLRPVWLRCTCGEARLQQWGNRHCANGGLGHDHELLPKQATDQDVVGAVTRRRDAITRTEADTEVLCLSLRIRIKLQQQRHLMMSWTRLEVKALRMDEEIMNFQWFELVTRESIKVLRGTTYVQPPTRYRFAYHKLNFHVPSFTTTLPQWHQSQLGKRLCSAAGTFWDDLQSTPPKATAQTFWMRDWNSFGLRTGQHFGPWYPPNCDIAPVQIATRRTVTLQMQSRVRKVATLARTGEKGRALAAARNAPPVPVTEQIDQEDQEFLPG